MGTPRRRVDRATRHRVAATYAPHQGGVVHRSQLREGGVGRDDVRSEVLAGRWATAGRHTVVVEGHAPRGVAVWWHAVWEAGSGAVLDGAAALLASGLTGYSARACDVSLPHDSHVRRVEGVVHHRRRTMPPVVGAGLPRVRPAYAAVHAAQWARTDRQAVLLLCLVVQQRLVRPADLATAWSAAASRSPRRGLLGAVVGDLCDGVHSLGELDFARLCREAGLPEPDRQAVRRGAGGRVYLDAAWEDIGLVVEIDGGHHAAALHPVDDALRQNDLALEGEVVLRIPVIGLRLAPERFVAQVVRAHALLSARRAA